MENRVVRLTESKARRLHGETGHGRNPCLGGFGRGFALGAFFRWGIKQPSQKTSAVFSGEPGLTVFTTKTVAAEQTQYPPSHEFSGEPMFPCLPTSRVVTEEKRVRLSNSRKR